MQPLYGAHFWTASVEFSSVETSNMEGKGVNPIEAH